jgi:SAM-dependent methyltransferase
VIDPQTARALVAINRAFYREQASAFSRTRTAPWPGWQRILATLPKRGLRILDVGCGNGRLARALAAAGIEVSHYVGVDTSRQLLARALEAARASGMPRVSGLCLDLADGAPPALGSGWALAASGRAGFDAIAVFGLLHHIPGAANRLALLRRCAEQLAPGGRLALSVWDFHERARFRQKQVPWAELPRYGFPPVDERKVEAGDRLLRWGENQVRYCHQVSREEREGWVSALPLSLTERFVADGAPGDLNEYFVFGRDV